MKSRWILLLVFVLVLAGCVQKEVIVYKTDPSQKDAGGPVKSEVGKKKKRSL